MRLVPGGAADEPKLARVVARRRPHPRSGDRVAAARARLVLRSERTRARAAHSPGGTAGTGQISVVGSRVCKVEALPAHTRIGACLPVEAGGIRSRWTRQAVGKGLGVGVGIVGVLGASAARLRPRHVLVLACCTIGAGIAHLQHALLAFRARLALLLIPLVCHADLRVARRARLQLVHPVLRRPRRVLYHWHHHIIASAR